MTGQREKFWNKLDGINSGMLGLTGDARLMSMSHYADTGAGKLWFITAKGTDLVDALAGGGKEAMRLRQGRRRQRPVRMPPPPRAMSDTIPDLSERACEAIRSRAHAGCDHAVDPVAMFIPGWMPSGAGCRSRTPSS